MSAHGEVGAARRYARALFNVTQSRGTVDEAAQSLNEVAASIEATPLLLNTLHNPHMTSERKRSLMGRIFSDVHADVARLMHLMVENDRADDLVGTAREYSRLVDEHRGLADAVVTSAVPLTPQQESALMEKLHQMSGQTIRLQTRIDENLLGGLVVRLGDRLIDASVATQLQGIREKLKQAKVI
jgi:F-type H+-transporting ATPase subunit delta